MGQSCCFVMRDHVTHLWTDKNVLGLMHPRRGTPRAGHDSELRQWRLA